MGGELVGSLTVAGLPPLTWVRACGWRCEAVIPAWAGFAAGDDGPPTTGAVCVDFDCPDVYARTPPTAGQVAAFRRLVDDAEAVRDAVLRAAFDELSGGGPNLDVDIDAVLGGPLADPGQLRRAFAPNSVMVLCEETDGEAWLDLDFDAAWDHEHGFMAVMVGGRVTHLGDR